MAHIHNTIKFGEWMRVRTVVPKLGQANAKIFGRLKLDEAEANELHTRGVL